MILWVTLLIIVIIVLVVVWCISDTPHPDVPQEPNISESLNFHEYPTIHSRCGTSDVCGGDLVCDVSSRRCKKTEGGNCAQDVDCAHGLHCVNWICSATAE